MPDIDQVRACLPVLAVIFEKVRRGDTVELAVPQARAWPDTIAFAQTGSEEFLTEAVHENVLYLGGSM